MILEKEKADYVVYAKGNTHGGIKDNVHTIPIYCIGKYDFWCEVKLFYTEADDVVCL